MNRSAKKHGTPLVNCGVSLFEGDAMGYVPGKTACLDCQMLGMLSRKYDAEKWNSRQGGCIAEPALIMPNQIAGALAVYQLKKTLYGFPSIIRFGSGEGLFFEKTPEKCLAECEFNNEKK